MRRARPNPRKRTGRYKLLFEAHCRMCGRPDLSDPPLSGARPLTRHHLVPQQYGGSNANHNIVPLCRPCHDLVDCSPWGDSRLARAMLRKLLTRAEMAHMYRRMGTLWVDYNYPIWGSLPTTTRPRIPRRMTRKQARRYVAYLGEVPAGWEKVI